MKKTTFLFAFCLSLIFVSCEKNPDELTITMNNAGTLTVNVTDSTKPVKGAEVSLYYNTYGLRSISNGITDTSGTFASEKLLEGNYECKATVKRGNATYTDSKFVQVIAANNTTVSLDPLNNSGTMSIKLINTKDNAPIVNTNVALVQLEVWHNNSIAQALKLADFTSKSDNQGITLFKNVPANVNYVVVAYPNDGNSVYSYNYDLYVQKQGSRNEILNFYY